MTNYTEIFHKLVAKRQADFNEPRNVAHMAVCRKHPEVRDKFRDEYNDLHRPGAVRRVS